MIDVSRRRAGQRRAPGRGLAATGTLMVHVGVAAMLTGLPEREAAPPPVYQVNLVAAPRPEPQARRAPETVDRPAEQAVPIAPRPRPTPAVPTPPPAAQPDVRREPAPRTTTPAEPLPQEAPATGSDVATVRTDGLEFAYPEYLRNITTQIYRRWNRPTGNQPFQAEIQFLLHRDGSISSLRFIRRSGNFGFDLEAQGAIEAAGNQGAFGPLPEGYPADVLPVNFFFDPQRR
ncbi:MAG: TonB C-terminal domain-containing protein [Gemmatimonadales bacterium]